VSGPPENENAPPSAAERETPARGEPSERERQLLDYMIEQAWEACLRARREGRPEIEPQ
jgi:hypothetical protein